MKAKILLTGIVAPLCFAACTSEEVVPQQEAAKIDLSTRPTLGKVALGFGDQTRATLNDEGYFNSLKWTDTDAVGARIIDTPKSGYVFGSKVYPFFGYDIATYASTNYKFEKSAGSEWTTDALMVEGNYMFYAPYNEKALYRDPLKMTFPTVQNINPASEINEKADANTDAIKEFFESENTYVVGYKFLAAEGQEKIVSPTMTHIYAYPQITLKNAYTVKEGDPAVDVAKPITIDSIVFISDKFYKDYTIKQQGLVDALKDAYAKAAPVKDANGKTIKEGLDKAEDAGTWNDATSLLKNALTNDIAEGETQTKKITVKFTEPLTIDAEGEFKFHMVMPAEAYATNNFNAVVYLSGQKSFIKDGDAVEFSTGVALTYAPGKRYAKQEYNFPAEGGYEIKDATAGDLATFTLAGNVDTYIAPTYISSAADFENYLKGINNNTKTVTEGPDFVLQQKGDYAEMTIDSSIVALRNKYLSAGKIIFTSNMNVEGDITLDANYTFNGKLTQKSGNLTLKKVADDNRIVVKKDATFNGTVTLDGATLEGDATFKGGVITDATIAGKATFSANKTTIKKMSATSTEITGGTVEKHNDGSATIGEITLKAGTLEVDQAGFITENSVVTIGTLNDKNEANTTGKLVLKKDAKVNKVVLKAGEIQNKAQMTGAGADFTAAWTRGTITNEGTIVIPSNGKFNVPANGTLNNKGVVTFTDATSELNNVGTINNEATMTVSSNEGKITVAEGSSTYVLSGSAAGEIDNTNRGALFLDGCSNTVTYTFDKLQTTEDIENFNAVLYGINKVIFNAGIDFNKKFDVPINEVFYGVNEIDINGGTVAVAANLAMPVNAKVMNITGNVTIDGFKKDVSTLFISHANAMAGKEGTKINVAKNAVLTIKEITVGANKVGSEEEAKLMFNFEKPTEGEAKAGVKAGAIKIQNANLYYGAAGTAVSAGALDANSNQASKYWNGTAWN